MPAVLDPRAVALAGPRIQPVQKGTHDAGDLVGEFLRRAAGDEVGESEDHGRTHDQREHAVDVELPQAAQSLLFDEVFGNGLAQPLRPEGLGVYRLDKPVQQSRLRHQARRHWKRLGHQVQRRPAYVMRFCSTVTVPAAGRWVSNCSSAAAYPPDTPAMRAMSLVVMVETGRSAKSLAVAAARSVPAGIHIPTSIPFTVPTWPGDRDASRTA